MRKSKGLNSFLMYLKVIIYRYSIGTMRVPKKYIKQFKSKSGWTYISTACIKVWIYFLSLKLVKFPCNSKNIHQVFKIWKEFHKLNSENFGNSLLTFWSYFSKPVVTFSVFQASWYFRTSNPEFRITLSWSQSCLLKWIVWR